MTPEVAAPLVAIPATIAVWLLARRVHRAKPHPLTNPVFLGMAGIILGLGILRVDYKTYAKGTSALLFLLKPAVVAFAIPLYRERNRIRNNLAAVLTSVAVGCVVGIVSATGLALLLGAPHAIARTMAPKSVTSPIALELSQQIGGMGELTVGVVIATGILGAMAGPEWLRLLGIRSRFAIGLAVGAASHGIGVARLEQEDRKAGGDLGKAMGIIAMTLNGLLTALTLPHILKALGW